MTGPGGGVPESRARRWLGFGSLGADNPEMTTTPTEADPADGGVADGGAQVVGGGIDGLRVRSFLGLSLGLVGPRANLAVSGVLLTLLVSSRVSSAVAITFALTANRFVGFIAYPLLGRASDRTKSAAGRRAPYMAAGLFLMGVCTWAYTLVSGFWLLVLLIVVVKTASVVFGLTNVAVIPETFGKSRTIKATCVIGVLGALVSLIIKGTVVATWKANNPATWNLPFREAGALMMIVAVIVLLLVREAPAGREAAEAQRRTPARSWRLEVADIMAGPNARVLVGGILVFWSGLSATGYLAIVYFEKIQHAGANVQTVAGYISGVPVVMFGLGMGYLLSRHLTRKQVAVLAPVAGTVVSLVQFTTTHIWQTVVLAFVGAPLFTAFVISLAPMLLQLLPRSGGMGELLGKLVAPFSLFAVAFSFLAAWAVDVTGDYRVIWLFPAAAGLVQAVVMCWLRVPRGHERAELQGLFERMSESILTQVTGRDRSLLGGVVTADDANAASLFDMARNVLGNPYEDDAGDGDPAMGDGAPTDDVAPPACSTAETVVDDPGSRVGSSEEDRSAEADGRGPDQRGPDGPPDPA
jgi:Na+/melibiose symporter-like transporter